METGDQYQFKSNRLYKLTCINENGKEMEFVDGNLGLTVKKSKTLENLNVSEVRNIKELPLVDYNKIDSVLFSTISQLKIIQQAVGNMDDINDYLENGNEKVLEDSLVLSETIENVSGILHDLAQNLWEQYEYYSSNSVREEMKHDFS